MTDQNNETEKLNIQADKKSVPVGRVSVCGNVGDISTHIGDKWKRKDKLDRVFLFINCSTEFYSFGIPS